MAAFVIQVAIESHIGTSTDGQQWLVNISDLKNNSLCDLGPNGHHFASPFPEVRDVGAACNFKLDSLSGQSVLRYTDAFTE